MNKIISFRHSTLPSSIGVLIDPLAPVDEKIVVARQLEVMLEEEFRYSSIRPQLAAWMYANSQMREDLSQASRLKGPKAGGALLAIFNSIKTILTDEQDAEYRSFKSTENEQKIAFLRERVLNVPFEKVETHNCFGIIIYAALLKDIISIRGGHELFSEILSSRFRGGGFVYQKGSQDADKVCVVQNGFLENIGKEDLEQLSTLSLEEGSIVIFSSNQAGTYDGVISSQHFYAHVGCVGKDRLILDFWEGTRINRRTIEEAAQQVIKEHKKINITVVSPPWKEYAT